MAMPQIGVKVVVQGAPGAKNALNQLGQAQNQAGQQAAQLTSQINKLANQIAALKAQYNAGASSTTSFARNMAALRAQALNMARGLAQDSTEFKRLNQAAASAQGGLNQANAALAGASQGSNSMLASLKGMAGAAAVAVAAIRKFGEYAMRVFEELREAARRVEIRIGFDERVESIGEVPENFLNALKKASRGTITEMQLMRASSRAMIMGVTQDVGALSTLVEFSTRRAKALGADPGQLFVDITTGIARRSPLILDNLGIIIKLREANDSYARSLGKTRQQLTASEQQQAVLNAVLKIAREENEKYAASGESVGDAYERLAASGTDAKHALLELAAINFAGIISGTANLLDNVTKIATESRNAALYERQREEDHRQAVLKTIEALKLKKKFDEADNLQAIFDSGYGGTGTVNLIKSGDLGAEVLGELYKQLGEIEKRSNSVRVVGDSIARGFNNIKVPRETSAFVEMLFGLPNILKTNVDRFFSPALQVRRQLMEPQTEWKRAEGTRLRSGLSGAVNDAGRAKSDMRDTMRDVEEVRKDFNQRTVELVRQNARKLADIEQDAAQRRLEIEKDFGQRMADLAKDHAKNRAEALEDFRKDEQRILKDREKDLAREARDNQREEARDEKDFQDESLRSWEDYQERRQDIERDSAKSIMDAIRNRDGQALRAAIEARSEQLSEAERDYEKDSRQRREDYETQKQERQKARQEAERERQAEWDEERRERQQEFDEAQRERQREYDERIAELRAQHDEELTELQTQTQRQREEQQRAYAEQMKDAQDAANQRLAELQAQYDAEYAAFQRSIQRQMEAAKAYAEWRVEMDRWMRQQIMMEPQQSGTSATAPNVASTQLRNSLDSMLPWGSSTAQGVSVSGGSVTPSAPSVSRSSTVFNSAPTVQVTINGQAGLSASQVEGAVVSALQEYHEGYFRGGR